MRDALERRRQRTRKHSGLPALPDEVLAFLRSARNRQDGGLAYVLTVRPVEESK